MSVNMSSNLSSNGTNSSRHDEIGLNIDIWYDQATKQTLLLILICLSFSVLIWLRLVTRNHQPLFFIMVLTTAYGFGFLARRIDYQVSLMDEPQDIIPMMACHLCAPLFIFSSSIGIDFSELSLNLVLSTSFMLLFGLFWIIITSFIIWPILHFSSGMTFSMTILFASVLCPKWAENSVQELDHVQGRNRDAQIILKLEQLCSTWLAYIMSEFMLRWIIVHNWPEYKPFHFVITIVYQLLGFIVGFLAAMFVRVPLNFAYNDVIAQQVIFLASLMAVQLFSALAGVSQGLATGTFSISLNSSKVKMSKDAEEFHVAIWTWYVFLAKMIITMTTGLILGLKRPSVIGIHHYGIIVVIFCISLSVRLLIILIGHLLINVGTRGSSTRNEIDWKRVLVVALGPFSGIVCTLLALEFFGYDEDLFFLCVSYVVGVVSLSILINASLFSSVLNVLGLYEYKRATIVNMNIAMSQVNTCRESAIFAQKSDLIVSDANWAIVENMTRLPHPYKKKLMETGYSEDRGDFRLRTVTCPNCNTEVIAPPTKSEIEDMILEAKQRVLKIQLVSFSQQYENGTLSRHSYRQLFSTIDAAANSKMPIIDSEPLNIQTQESKGTRLFRNFFSCLTELTRNQYNYVPTNLFRLLAYYLVTSRTFITIMAILVLTDTIIIFRLLTIWHFQRQSNTKEYSDAHLEFGKIVEIFNLIFFVIFTFEILIQFLGLGTEQYLTSDVNKIEFSAHLVRTTDVIMYLCAVNKAKELVSSLRTGDFLLGLKWALLIRVVRVYVFMTGWLPKFLSMVEKQVEDELMRNYEVGKGYLVSLDKVMRFLSHVTIYENVYSAVKAEIETERKKVAKVLSLIQKEYPSIAITVKTRHAIRLVTNSIADCINDLKEDGILDVNESAAINESLEKVKNDLREMPMVNPALAQGILKTIPWLPRLESSADVIMRNAKLISYDYNDTIIHVGDDPVGLYVLVSGLVKAFYNPTPKTIQLNAKFGMLPNYDFFDVLRIDQAQDSCIVSGSAIGELGIVTGRRYDMNVVCETSVQLYFIPWSDIKSIVHESDRSLLIQNEIWKYIGIRLAVVLIQSKPAFAEWPKERLLEYLENGWIPFAEGIKCLNIGDEISDMILIEGVCMDSATSKVYVAPVHLPRGISLLLLPDHPKWVFQTVYSTKILILPFSPQLIPSIMANLYVEHERIEASKVMTARTRKVVISDGDGDEDDS